MSAVFTQNYFLLGLRLPGAAENVTLGGSNHVSAGDGALVLQHGGTVVQLHSPDRITDREIDIRYDG